MVFKFYVLLYCRIILVLIQSYNFIQGYIIFNLSIGYCFFFLVKCVVSEFLYSLEEIK